MEGDYNVCGEWRRIKNECAIMVVKPQLRPAVKPPSKIILSSSSLCIGLAVLLSACNILAQPKPLPDTAEPVAPATTPSWLQLYFTDPSAASAQDYEGGPDLPLVNAINAARLSVDVAAYSLNLWSIRNALIRAEQRGVVVRMVMESDNMDNVEVQDLKDAGIPILGDQQEGLMHDKFVVIDRTQVWTGSMNFTVGGAYKDNNVLISIRSSQVAQDYTQEFEEMYAQHRFGSAGNSDTPYPELAIDETKLEVYFSPDDDVDSRIVELIQAARESVLFLAYSFTSNDIGQAMLEKMQAGIPVQGVMDDGSATQQGNEYDPFMAAGLDVLLDGNAKGLMHHKLIIIDWQIVITGSYNFTASAEESNDENLIIIHDPRVAEYFVDEFQRVYREAQQP